MRGIGGPLLSIGDLLSDLSESNTILHSPNSPSSTHLQNHLNLHLHPSDLSKNFQENYDELNKALSGTDHSWTSLTLKLCDTLDTAKKLIESTNSNVTVLSEKVGDLEKIIKKGDSAIAEVRSLHSSLSQRIASSSESEA
ncbi:hypothetical protein RND81_01G218100 [Saponaria officinalis]|uniref:Uncharacterized protein n=1 Tax=Saponaria officinalis TaxID=3572 RepID=A0AAW1N907_SAPOF